MNIHLSRNFKLAGLSLAVIVTAAGVNLSHKIPGFGILGLFGLLFVPGLLLLISLRAKHLSTLEWVLYSLGTSLLLLMAQGLIANQLLPVFGIAQPLSFMAITPWTLTFLCGLLALAYKQLPITAPTSIKLPSLVSIVTGFSILLLPLLSALGAINLNNHQSGIYTLVCYGLIGALVLFMLIASKRIPTWLWSWSIFAIALALLWSTSLRGWFITGHDIQLEYYVFRLTNASGKWSMASFQDAYNACLSITILPASLKSLTNISGLWLYKIYFQIIFALLTTGIFGIARRYASSAVAFLASFIFVAFPTFALDMPMLIRQEIAFGFFILLLLAIYNPKLTKFVRTMLLISFGSGLILSHYSSTFTAAGLFAGAYLVMWPWRLRIRSMKLLSDKRRIKRTSGITIEMVAVILAGSLLWTGLYTKTGGNIVTTITKVAHNIPRLLQPKSSNDNSTYPLLKTISQTPEQKIATYTTLRRTENEATAIALGGFYPLGNTPDVLVASEPSAALNRFGKWLSDHHIKPSSIFGQIKTAYAISLEGLMIASAFLLFYYQRKHHKYFRLDHDFLALAGVGIILLIVEAINPVIDYGIFRMLQQDLVFLALPITLSALQILRWCKISSERVRLGLLGLGLVVAFWVTSGAMGGLTGGIVEQLPFSNSGFYYEAYYTNASDMALFEWLSGNYPTGYPIYTDMFLRMKIRSQTSIVTREGIVPAELPKTSYVVLNNANITQHRVAQYYSGELIYYQTPLEFLDNNKDLIYSSNQARVYK